MLLVALSAAALANDWLVGAQVAAGQDLPASEALPSGALGTGGALVVPIRWSPRPGATLRIDVGIDVAVGSDRVEWTPEGEDTPVYSQDHWTLVTSGRLLAGPEWTFAPNATRTPYLAMGGGVAGVMHFHTFSGDTEALGEGLAGELAPYSLQAVPTAGAALGLRFGRPGRLAVELEGGYTAAFLPVARLQRAPPALGAIRSAYALDVVRLGIGVALPL